MACSYVHRPCCPIMIYNEETEGNLTIKRHKVIPYTSILGEKLTSNLAKDIETNEKELQAWMDKHSAIYREMETTYNEMSGY